jgi:hypothetical protein
MSTRLHITMEEDLLARVDELRGDVPRAAWIRGAVRLRAGEAPAVGERKDPPVEWAFVPATSRSAPRSDGIAAGSNPAWERQQRLNKRKGM